MYDNNDNLGGDPFQTLVREVPSFKSHTFFNLLIVWKFLLDLFEELYTNFYARITHSSTICSVFSDEAKARRHTRFFYIRNLDPAIELTVS